MKIIKQSELGFLPNGTVYSEFLESGKPSEGYNMFIGLNIVCGHHEQGYFSKEEGHFNGVLHMLEGVDVNDGVLYDEENDEWNVLTDTCEYDYDEDEYFLVYDKNDIEKIIKALQWALTECNGELE